MLLHSPHRQIRVRLVHLRPSRSGSADSFISVILSNVRKKHSRLQNASQDGNVLAVSLKSSLQNQARNFVQVFCTKVGGFPFRSGVRIEIVRAP